MDNTTKKHDLKQILESLIPNGGIAATLLTPEKRILLENFTVDEIAEAFNSLLANGAYDLSDDGIIKKVETIPDVMLNKLESGEIDVSIKQTSHKDVMKYALQPIPKKSMELLLQEDQRIFKWGEIAAQSNLFPDSTSQAKAIMIIAAGREIGLEPFESLANVNFLEGKPIYSAACLASKVKEHPDYDYDVSEMTAERCRIEFSDKRQMKKKIFEFTMKEANDSGLSKGKIHMYQKFPKEMLFNRCITRGIRVFCPHIGKAGVYTEADDFGENPRSEFTTTDYTISGNTDGKKDTSVTHSSKTNAKRNEDATQMYADILDLAIGKGIKGKDAFVAYFKKEHADIKVVWGEGKYDELDQLLDGLSQLTEQLDIKEKSTFK